MTIPALRQDAIVTELTKHDRVVVRDLAERLHVSRETIRRDLKELEVAGQLRCTYGGAIRAQSEGDAPISRRMRTNAKEKALVARLATRLLRDDTTIFVDAGTTTLAFAHHLINRDRIRVFTNSLDIAQLLSGGSVEELCVIGGRVRPDYRAMLGPLAIEAIERHVFDMAFVSVAAVDPILGYMDFGQDEASLRRKLSSHAREIVMLADNAKFARTATVRSLDLREAKYLVTDKKPAPAFAKLVGKLGGEIIHA